jgi:IPT/TIG domain-containing protein
MAQSPRQQLRERGPGDSSQAGAALSHRKRKVLSRWLDPGSLPRLWHTAALASLCLLLGSSAARAAPAIQGVSREQGTIGSYLTLYGTDFGSFQGQSYVLLANRFVPAEAWSDVAVTIILEPQITDSPLVLDTTYPLVVVKQPDGERSNEFPFRLIYGLPPTGRGPGVPRPVIPHITGASVLFVNAGDPRLGFSVTLHGEGFGDAQGQGVVEASAVVVDAFGRPSLVALPAAILDWTDNYISAFLPPQNGLLFFYRVGVLRGDNGLFDVFDLRTNKSIFQ